MESTYDEAVVRAIDVLLDEAPTCPNCGSLTDEHLAAGVCPKCDGGLEPRPAVNIGDLAFADQLVRALRYWWRRIAEIEKVRDDEIARIESWATREFSRIEPRIRSLELSLEAYHRRLLAANPRQKTISLPSGELRIRAQKPAWEVNAEQVVSWAREIGRTDLLRERVEPNLLALQQNLEVRDGRAFDPTTGEIVPGIQVTERPPRFSVRVDEVEEES